MTVNLSKSLKNIFLFILAIILLGVLVTDEGSYDKTYLITLSTTFIIFFLFWDNIKFPKSMECYIPMIFFLVWFYGFFLGILRNNNISFVLRNFAGMTVYLFFYFILLYKIDIHKLAKLLLIISDYYLYLTLIVYITTCIFKNEIFFHIPILNRFQYARSIEYFSRELIYVSFVVATYKVFIQKKQSVFLYFKILLTFIVEFFCIRSGGDCLATVILFGLVVFISLFDKPKMQNWFFIILIFAILILFSIIKGQTVSSILFSPNDKGNKTRYEQIHYVLTEVRTFFGYGLGSNVNPKWHYYSIEVIYLNLYHKFGAFCLLLYYGYFYTLIKAMKLLNNKNYDIVNAIPLGCMGYTISALANPMLFVPQNVMLHIIALYILYSRKYQK